MQFLLDVVAEFSHGECAIAVILIPIVVTILAILAYAILVSIHAIVVAAGAVMAAAVVIIIKIRGKGLRIGPILL